MYEEQTSFSDDAEVTEESMPDDLFGEGPESETTEPEQATEETQAEESETAGQPEQTQQNQGKQQTFKIKHLGEEREVTSDELITLAQKGADYDRIREKYDSMKDYRQDIEFIDQLVKESGMKKSEYFETVRNAMKENQLQGRISELITQGVDENTARYTAELELENRRLESQVKEGESVKEAQQKERQSIYDEIGELTKLYPNLKEFPPEVMQKMREGMRPAMAYQSYLIEQQNIKIKQLEQNKKVKSKSIGSVKSEGATEDDPFLSAFDANY